MAPSEGIEPPVEEPESSVLSITPRGHFIIGKLTRNAFENRIVLHLHTSYALGHNANSKIRLFYYTNVYKVIQLLN